MYDENIIDRIEKIIRENNAGAFHSGCGRSAFQIMQEFDVAYKAPKLPDEEFRNEGNPNHNPYHHFVSLDGLLIGDSNALIDFAIRILLEACHTNAVKHGWWENGERNFGEVIALIHSEASEALEAYRDGDNMQVVSYEQAGDGVDKPVGVASEFADILIRIFDTCKAMRIPLVEAIIQKHNYNYTRPYRHGGKNA